MAVRDFLLAIELGNELAPTEDWLDIFTAADESGAAFAVVRDSFEPADRNVATLDAHLLATRAGVRTQLVRC